MLEFFLSGHDLTLVLLAAAVCLVSTYACVGLMRHAQQAKGRMRLIWNGVSALAVGLGIWGTHFIAMLAFRPGITLAYDVPLTALSLLIAILVCGGGIALAVHSGKLIDRVLGGATVGVGISVMHYTGIAAVMLEGDIVWDSGIVALSILGGMVLSALAFAVTTRSGWRSSALAATLLAIAICTLHFTSMSGADFSNCLPMQGATEIDSLMLSILVAMTSLLVLAAAIGSIVLDEADRRRTAKEMARRAADAQRVAEANERLNLALTHMGQGLALFDGDGRLLLHNQRLPALLGLGQTNIVGVTLVEILKRTFSALSDEPEEASRRAADLAEEYTDMIQRGGGELVQLLGDDRALRIRHSPAAEGAWITTVEDISESRRNAAAIAHLAHHDSLTGLPNRARFISMLDGALGNLQTDEAEKLAVIAIDLNRFKDINDSCGHAAGDHVLRVVSERLKNDLKDGEIVARIGGDEFAAIKPFTTMTALRDFLTRIEAALSGRVTYGTTVLNVSGSVGVAIAPDDGLDRSKLLNNADLALYRAKDDPDQRICYYEQEMDEAARERRAIAKDLWTAIDTNAFHLAYQVQKSVVTGETTGYEVLLRWNRPGHGPVSPAEFIPIAEECGAIGSIGAWVLANACREAALWPEPHKIAVNVSGLQLSQTGLPDLVRMVLDETGLAPERLELEVTETAIISDRKRALAVLNEIKQMGVSIAIDDFGTGYSSLDTLRSFPFDKIKLDRSFMAEVENDDQAKAIVRAILALGKSLSVPVLAEGVETSEQLEVLRVEGCTEAQGFLLGRPAPLVWDEKAQKTA